MFSAGLATQKGDNIKFAKKNNLGIKQFNKYVMN